MISQWFIWKERQQSTLFFFAGAVFLATSCFSLLKHHDIINKSMLRKADDDDNSSAKHQLSEEGINCDGKGPTEEEEGGEGEHNLRKKIMQTLEHSAHGVPGQFKTLESVVLVLRMARTLFGSENISLNLQSALDTFYSSLDELERKTLQRSNYFDIDKVYQTTQIVVVEGLSASGKSTVVDGLVARGAKRMDLLSHYEDLAAIRGYFMNIMPDLVVRAFEFACIYFLAQFCIESGERVVVIERFYHSICAQNVCLNAVGEGDIKALPLTAFEWPIDLQIPTLVIYLQVSSEARLRRRRLCGGTSATERSSDRSVARDARALLAYSLVKCSVVRGEENLLKTIALDASGPPDDVISSVLAACKEHNIALDYPPSICGNDSNENDEFYGKRISMGVYGAFSDLGILG